MINITKNMRSSWRINIDGVNDNRGVKCYQGCFGKIIGWIAAKILHKAVLVETNRGKLYVNIKSLFHWKERQVPGVEFLTRHQQGTSGFVPEYINHVLAYLNREIPNQQPANQSVQQEVSPETIVLNSPPTVVERSNPEPMHSVQRKEVTKIFDITKEKVLHASGDDIMRQYIVEVNPKFLDDFSDFDTNSMIDEISKDVSRALNECINNKFGICFKTDQLGSHEVKNPERIFIYLKAIDSALRECKNTHGMTPSVSIILRYAGISDEMMPTITKLIEDGLIGAPDINLNTCLINLRDNKLTPKSLLPFASAIKSTDVFAVYLDGNQINKETTNALYAWKDAPLGIRIDTEGRQLIRNPRTLSL